MKAGPVEFRHHTKLMEYPVSAKLAYTGVITADTCPLTHPYVEYDSTAGATTLTVPDGEEGQILYIDHSTDGGNVDVAATTATGWSAIALDDVGDKCVLFYVDDTIGWIIWSLIGVAAPPLYTDA